MLRGLVLALICLSSSVTAAPVTKAPEAKREGDFKAFLPMVSRIVTYTGAIIPTAMSVTHKHTDEFNLLVQTSAEKKHGEEFGMLLQTHDAISTNNETDTKVAETTSNASTPLAEDAAIIPSPDMPMLRRLPDPEFTIESMREMGQKAATYTGYNPIEMMEDLLGVDGFKEVIENVTLFENEFPQSVTQEQVEKAEMMVITMGVFGPDSEANKNATDNFMGCLSDKQVELIHTLNQNVIDRVLSVIVDPQTGEPTESFVNESNKMIQRMDENPYMKLLNLVVDELDQQPTRRQPLGMEVFNFIQYNPSKGL